jgi:F-type H+-transporting ATPase subunit b
MRTSVLTSALLLSVNATTLVAQEAAVEKGGGVNLLEPHGGLMFWTLLIFVVLMFILTRFAFKPLTAAVEAREKSLQDAIDSAKRDREAASALLEEQKNQLEAARAEAQKLIADGRATAEKLRNDMLDQTRAQNAELLERAKREIEAEKVRAVADLRREAVDLAIAGASRVIERNLDDQANRKLVENFLASVPIAAARR